MPPTPPKVPHEGAAVGFTLVCLLGMIFIATALGIEWSRVRKGRSLLGARVFRWRLVSGIVWMLMLGSFAYATWFLWPAGAPLAVKLQFLRVINGGLMLLFVAFGLFVVDLRLVLRERRLGEQKLQRQMTELLDEAQRRKAQQSADGQTHTASRSPRKSSDQQS